jgi:hypothetical protein
MQVFGATSEGLRFLDEDGPDLLPYASLVAVRREGDGVLAAVTGVYEWQGAPLMFVAEADRIAGAPHIHKLRRLLAMRGDAPYLGVVAPGRLDVYRVALDRRTPGQSSVDLEPVGQARDMTMAYLANIRPRAAIHQRDWISSVVLKLLTGSIDSLIHEGVSDEDAISLVGRALFTRFLADRHLLPSKMSGTAEASLFDDQATAERTCEWLDETFNGDLLPLSPGIFNRLPDQAYLALGHVLRRAPDGALFLGWEQRWDNLDFAHIPVGVLSQAYELYLRRHAPARQRREGGYYTPRPIADLMVRACMASETSTRAMAGARILDPAAGAGVFLLTAFRELVAARWAADDVRPNTKVLRSVLYGQIVGFDINEAALRFAALGLYLLSIELDPEPKPVDKLKFEDLRGRVLHLVAGSGDDSGADLGSLGPAVGDEHRGRYDIVIGNPPWSSGTQRRDWGLVEAEVAAIAQRRQTPNRYPPLPNEVMDLPFVWRAMDWAKPGGTIAFALHARLLFQQGDGMAEARLALFETLDISAVINGVELRQTKVWPEISAPFCILIARNRQPGPGASFRLVTPRFEETLNAAGQMRIDPQNAETIATTQLRETPEILKILFRGSKADLGIIERVRNQGHPTLKQFWADRFGLNSRGRLLGAGNGYQTLKPSSRVRRHGDGLPGADASYLNGLPEMTVSAMASLSVDTRTLSPFTEDRIHDPRDPQLFTGPLLLVHQSPPVQLGRVQVAVSDRPLVYNETFYGYSAAGFEGGEDLVRYLALIVGSRFVLWLALVTSGKFGFEREVLEKASLERMPIPDFLKLPETKRREARDLFDGLVMGRAQWDEVDEWVAALYGLGRRDRQVIFDTLKSNLPFAENRRHAQAIPDHEEITDFQDVLLNELQPWAERYRTSIRSRSLVDGGVNPWFGFELTVDRSDTSSTLRSSQGGLEADLWAGLLHAADAAATSEIIIQDGNRLVVGRLAQGRYWTPTQARLLAQRILWSHLAVLQSGDLA